MSEKLSSKPAVEAVQGGSASLPTLVAVYNRYLVDMLMAMKKKCPGLKKALVRAGHKAIEPVAVSHIECAARTLPRAALLELAPEAASLRDVRMIAFEPLEGLSVGTLVSECDAASMGCDALLGYVYTFAVLCAAFTEVRDSPSAALIGNVLQVLSLAQAPPDAVDTTVMEAAMDGILVDDVVTLLQKLSAVARPAAGEGEGQGEGEGDNNIDAMLKSLENSKIGDLAREITQEIDMGKLASENPAELLNFANLTDTNSPLGNIVSKVGSKIQAKLQNGELRHDDLLGEAVSLLKALDTGGKLTGNPLVGGLLNAAASGRLNMGAMNNMQRSASARDRLRQRFEQKQNK